MASRSARELVLPGEDVDTHAVGSPDTSIFAQLFAGEVHVPDDGAHSVFRARAGAHCSAGTGKGVQRTVSVLDRTETVGGIVTRVIEERETRNGKLVEISLNYFAICAENQNVFGIVGMKR